MSKTQNINVLHYIYDIKDVTNMTENELEKAIKQLTKEIAELRKDINDMKRGYQRYEKILELGIPPPKQGLEVPPWLRFEVMESLARAEKLMSTEEVAESVNERRGMVGEKTSRASVSRAVSELVKNHFVIKERVGRRVLYRLTGKAQILFSEGKTLEEAVQEMIDRVIESEGRKCSSYMMSIITPSMRKDAKKIADEIFADENKKGEISLKASNRYTRSEISVLLIP